MSRKFANVNWDLPADDHGHIRDWTALQAAILMDIRDELRKINEILRYRPADTTADNLLTMPEKKAAQ
jgi:hypothetical protein